MSGLIEGEARTQSAPLDTQKRFSASRPPFTHSRLSGYGLAIR